MKQITATITREQIEEGIPKECDACPLAFAVWQTLLDMDGIEPEHAWVGSSTIDICFEHEGKRWVGIVPHSAASRRFVERFDAGYPVFPSTFKLRVGVLKCD